MADAYASSEIAVMVVRGKKVVVDSDVLHELDVVRWHITPLGYAASKHGLMPRIILDAKKGEVVDHINGDILDNRRSNLRICTHAENMRNRRSVSGASKYKGVKIDIRPSGNRRIRAAMTHNRKTINLGTFETEEAAARAYDVMAKKVQGEFACTNFDLGLLTEL